MIEQLQLTLNIVINLKYRVIKSKELFSDN